MSDDPLLVERRGNALWLTLHRPEARNALTATLMTALERAIAQAHADPTLRALVVTGAGDDTFCIGSDLAFLTRAFESRDFSLFRDYLERLNAIFLSLEALPIPTIAMVQGRARAAGFELLAACDFVLIAEEAEIGDVHTPFGHMPGGGASQRLTRKIGLQRGLELLLTGKWISGTAAQAMGLALRCVPRRSLRAEVERFIVELTERTVRESLKHIKHAVLRGWDLPLADAVALEARCYLEYLATSEEPTRRFFENQAKRRSDKEKS